jgi:GTP-binding protein
VYSPELAQKPYCVVFTKLDLLGEEYIPPVEAPDAFGMYSISAAGRNGIDQLLGGWWTELLRLRVEGERRDATLPLP